MNNFAVFVGTILDGLLYFIKNFVFATNLNPETVVKDLGFEKLFNWVLDGGGEESVGRLVVLEYFQEGFDLIQEG